MKISEKLINIKLLVITISVTFLFSLIVCRLFYVQIISADTLTQKAYSQWCRDLKFTANRGEILDRNGVVLSSSTTTFTLYSRPNEIKDCESIANKIKDIVDIKYDDLIKKLSKKGVSEVTIAKNLTKNQMLQLIKLNINGLYLTADSKRFYPYGNFLSQTLGFVSSDNIGQTGLELIYDDLLTGVNGASYTETDLVGRKLQDSITTYVSAVDGCTLNLTIDYNIQTYVEKAVNEALLKYEANSASCIMMNANTGEVVALASAPTYDLNNIPRDDLETLNKQSKLLLVSDVYEPGSTFKIITSSIGLEESKIKQSYYCPGYSIVDGKRIRCWRSIGHGSQNFPEGICNSCNCVFMDIALSVGKEKMYDYFEKFGLKNKTGLDFPGEVSSIMIKENNVKNVDLARIGFGQAVAVTPIQLITAVCSILNGGNLVTPHLVSSVYDSTSKMYVLKNSTEIKNKTVSKETSNLMREYLINVVEKGSGKNAKVSGYTIGGKTGTSQKYENGVIARGKYVSSFLGFTDINDETYVCLFLVDEPKGYLYYGSIVAAPFVGNIFENTLMYMGVKRNDYDSKTIIMPNLTDLSLAEAIAQLKNANIEFEYSGEQGKVNYQIPAPLSTMDENCVVYFNVE